MRSWLRYLNNPGKLVLDGTSRSYYPVFEDIMRGKVDRLKVDRVL